MKNIVVSPIFYMGNKRKLINKGLCELFPKDIETFVDLFSGSGIVSMNIKANKIIINDIDTHLIELYQLFKKHTANEIILHMERRINDFGLPKERTKRNKYDNKGKIEQYKAAYFKLRNEYNKTKSVLDFYTLMFYSFSQQFRFNSKGEFNMPFGNDYFSESNKQYIYEGCNFFHNGNIQISNIDFKNFDIDNLTKNDFIYLDPPYSITTAVYTENRNGYAGWSEIDEISLYQLCELLNKKNIKFGMSNIFYNKGNANLKLIDWCNYNHFNTYNFSSHTYSACGKGNSMAKEVFISNYQI